MSYSRSEKAIYLSVAIGTAIIIITIAVNYNRNPDGVITFSMQSGTFHAVKVPSNPYEEANVDGYKFKWLPRDKDEVYLLCDVIQIRVTAPSGQEYSFRPCNSAREPASEFYPILYEGEKFGYAYNSKEEQGYFVVKVSDNILR